MHVWHEDNGFQKTKIINKAILKATCDYLIFTDGDCIPRRDFVANHLKHKQEGYFLSGGYFKLPIQIAEAITEKDIINQDCFNVRWLLQSGLKLNFKLTKLTQFKLFAKFLNWLTPT